MNNQEGKLQNNSSLKASRWHFIEIDKLIPKFIWKIKGPRINKTILERTKLEDSQIPISKLPTKLQ